MNEAIINTVQRREQIVDILCQEGTVSVNLLSQKFNVSTVTIRNDLRKLEEQGCLLRSYGGALLNKSFAFDKPLQDKRRINFVIKNAIAKEAANLVSDGDCIILDSGSTTSLMVPYLKDKKNIIVMTNALNIAYDLVTNTEIKVVIAGGSIRKNAYSISGPTVTQLLEMHHFNKLFLGVDGFDLTSGITTPNFDEAIVNKVMCKVSQQIITVTDSSKFGRSSFCTITNMENIDILITDSKIPINYYDVLTEHGVKIILADKVSLR